MFIVTFYLEYISRYILYIIFFSKFDLSIFVWVFIIVFNSFPNIISEPYVFISYTFAILQMRG